MEAFDLETGYWPVVVFRGRRSHSDEELGASLSAFRALVIERPEPYCVVLDLRQVRQTPPSQRAQIQQRMRDPMTKAQCRGAAMVFSSASLKMLLNTVLCFQKPDYPKRVFKDYFEALTWAYQQVGRTEPPVEVLGA